MTRAVCSYYINAKRIGLVIEKITKMKDVAVYPVNGTVVRTQKGVSVVGSRVAVVIFGKTNELPLLLTNMKQYENFNGKAVSIDESTGDSVLTQALALCQHKYATSKNNYMLTFGSQGCSIVATPKATSHITYIIHSPSGDIITESRDANQTLLDKCASFKAFQYNITTDTCERNVIIKRGQSEIFKEIAHYTGKSLVFTSVENNIVTRELCITSTGCCELQMTRTEHDWDFRVVKVPFTKVAIDPSSKLSALDCTLDILMRSKCFSQALRGGA